MLETRHSEPPNRCDFFVASAASVAVVLGAIMLVVSHNEETVWREQLIRPLWILPLFTIGVCTLLYVLRARNGLFAFPMFLLLLFAFRETFNRVALQIIGWSVEQWVETMPDLLLAFYFVPHFTALLLLIVFFFWVRLFRHIEPRNLTLLLLVFVTVTVSFDAKSIFSILLEDTDKENFRIAPAELIQQVGSAVPQKELPDIFLVVPDRYPSNRILQEFYDYDNTPFLNALAARGFRIPSTDTRSNYNQTYMSMASSLNLSFLGDEVIFSGVVPTLRDNLLVKTLKRLNYQYIHMAGWWSGTRRAHLADSVYNGTHALQSKITEFEETLAAMTPLRGLYLTIMERIIENVGSDHYECNRIKRQFEHIRNLQRDERPLFVLFHVYIPHSPVTMDRMGECIPNLYLESLHWLPEDLQPKDFQATVAQLEEERYKPLRKAAVDYMLHLNDELLEIFDIQRARSHALNRKFLFVIQSDEGPYPLPLLLKIKDKKIDHDMTTFPTPFLREKYGIVNAIYSETTPGVQVCAIQSPVNTWRVLLGEVLQLRLPLLPDRYFSPPLYPLPRNTRLRPADAQLGARHTAPGPGCAQPEETL